MNEKLGKEAFLGVLQLLAAQIRFYFVQTAFGQIATLLALATRVTSFKR